MKTIKDLNERLLAEIEEEKDKEKPKSLKSKEFRDTMQQYKGRVSGSSDIEVDYKELKNKLEDKVRGINWTLPNVKKVFEVVTKMIGVQPEDKE